MKKVIYFLAFMHLILICLCIFHVPDKIFAINPGVEKPLTFIRSINYSVCRYGFFATYAGMSNEIEIKIYDTEGYERKYSTTEGFNFFLVNNDLMKRFKGLMLRCEVDTLIPDLCARSIATRMINLFPGTRKVTFTLRSISYPRSGVFSKDAPAQIKKVYSTDFILPVLNNPG